MVGTDECLTDAENVYIVQYTEEENMKIAKQHGFIGLLATNTNPLTQVRQMFMKIFDLILNFEFI